MPRYELAPERRGRKIRKGAIAVTAALAIGAAGTGAVVETEKFVNWLNTPNVELKDIHPTTNLENFSMKPLQIYADYRNDKKLDPQDAAILTQAAIFSQEDTAYVEYQNYMSNDGASSPEAVVLTLTSITTKKGVDVIGDMYKNALNTDPDNAALITSIAASYDQPVENVSAEFSRVKADRNFQDDNAALIPSMVSAKYAPGGQARADEVIAKARQAGITDTTDISTIVRTDLSTGASLDEIFALYAKCSAAEFSPYITAELLPSMISGKLSFEDVVTMYTFIGQVPDMTEEAAAMLVSAATDSVYLKNYNPDHPGSHSTVFAGRYSAGEGDVYFYSTWGSSTEWGSSGYGRGGVSSVRGGGTG